MLSVSKQFLWQGGQCTGFLKTKIQDGIYLLNRNLLISCPNKNFSVNDNRVSNGLTSEEQNDLGSNIRFVLFGHSKKIIPIAVPDKPHYHVTKIEKN